MVIHTNEKLSQEHVLCYNRPQNSKLFAIIPKAADDNVGKRDIVLWRRGQLNANRNEMFETIPIIPCGYDPLFYVLLLLYGTDGWKLGGSWQVLFSRPSKRKKIPPLMISAYQKFLRPGQLNTVPRGAWLLQRYVVDQCCKVDTERVAYLQSTQQELWAFDYTAICKLLGDSANIEVETDAVRAGHLFILPSLRVGEGRCMCQNMHDIITIFNTVRYFDMSFKWLVINSGKSSKIHCFRSNKLLIGPVIVLGFFASSSERWWRIL